jgi:DMSO/TMAO reductase YedYZ molybdopterin-dependent catalytic subunit
LSPEHGFPLRLVVPGYYGTNSTKWLWRLRLAALRAPGPLTTRLYNDRLGPREIAAGLGSERPVWAQAPEAIVVQPAPQDRLPAGKPTEIWGWAWAFQPLAAVEVSVDGGASYLQAELEPRSGWSWQRFSRRWTPDRPGPCRVSARALTAAGVGQPASGARNAVHSVEVEVGGT